MRGILIAVVLGLTALTFYSALWFKSETIERDITDRVTENLNETGAKDIGVDVDGRHVTLSGIVYDAQVEADHLDTADTTYGALGPIDGLTYLQDGGYILASKTDSGITLRGTVPDEATRAALIASAADATDGAVDDQLTIAGPVAAWQDEASFGMGQLAGLTTGTLTAAAGAYALSGVASGDADAVRGAVSEREGWQAFVSQPSVTEDLSQEVARLSGDVATRDATIAELQASVADLDTATAGLTQERDALGVELDGLRASMTEGQTDAASLRARLDAAEADVDTANGVIAQRDATIADLSGQLTDAQGQVADLTTQADGMNGRIAALETELVNRQAASGSTDEQVAALNVTVAGLTAGLAQREARVADLTGVVAERDAQVADLSGVVAERDAQVADLTGVVAQRDAQVAELSGTVEQTQAQIDALQGNVQERDVTIAALRNQTPAAPVAFGAAQCAAQAGAVLEGTQINFRTATATIDDGSVDVLERLTGIALACVGEDLAVEVGGHTDNQGSDANNQALSEARAQAVVAFMAERGVPTDGLLAAGYGESQPVADNDTAEGRAQNRRISFEWQAR